MAKPIKAAAPKATDTPPETPAAETPPAAPAPEAAPAPTPEEIEAQVADTMAAAFGPVSSAVNAKIQEQRAEEGFEAPPVEAEAPAKDLSQDEAPEGGESVRSEPEKPTAEPEPPKPVQDRFVPWAMTPADVEATARQAAREEYESRTDEQPPTTDVPHGTSDEAGLSEVAQDQLVVLKQMAAQNPAHRDLPARQKEFWKKEEKHRSQWEQANPGSMFDPNAAEHAEFYRKNEPFVPVRDFESAKRSIIAHEAEERAVTRVRKEQEPRLRAIELREREREAAPLIANAMADAAEEVFAAAPQFKDTFKPKELTKEAVEKMAGIDPVLAKIARDRAELTTVLVGEAEKLGRFQGDYLPDMSKQQRLSNGDVIAPHAILQAKYAECEAEYLAKPEAEQIRGGKKLLSYEDVAQRADRIHRDPKLKPEQRARALENIQKSFWWVQSKDVVKFISAENAGVVRDFAKMLEETDKLRAKGTAANGHTPKPAVTEPPKVALAGQRQGGKAGLVRGTATTSASDVADNAPRSQTTLQKSTEELAKLAFR